MYLLRGVQRAQHLGKVAVQARSYRVCIADPRIILNQPEAALDTAAGKALMIDVPDAFADKLSRGEHSLGDADDPENSWKFGRQGELFQMTFVGSIDASSGFTSIVPAAEVERIQGDRASRPTWEELKTLLSAHDVQWPQEGYPFLFVGHILEADTASVFQLGKGKDIDGLQITSSP